MGGREESVVNESNVVTRGPVGVTVDVAIMIAVGVSVSVSVGVDVVGELYFGSLASKKARSVIRFFSSREKDGLS